MAENILINSETYKGVESVELNTTEGKKVLFFQGQPVSVVQGTGDSETAVMSQAAVTKELSQLSNEKADEDIPKVFLTGDEFSNMTTDKNEVNMEMDYRSKTESFHAYIAIKFQGSTSLNYDKKNFTIKMFSDESHENKLKKAFRDWGVEKHKYVLKANYIDHSHARNIIGARLWNEVVESRNDYDTLPEELRNSPKNGAVDGFPIKLYVNGTYQGVYTWNIGKDDWTFGMDEDNPNHVVLGAGQNSDGVFKERPYNFRTLWDGVSVYWEVEIGTAGNAVTTAINNLISFVMNNNGSAFKNGIGTYLDVQSAIDYYIHQYVICGSDNLAKNMLLATYDGTKWICSAYDMDATFGITYDGRRFYASNLQCPEGYQEKFSLLWERMEENFWPEIQARYAELRNTVYTVSNMFTHFERLTDVIGKDLYEEDLEVYPSIPSGDSNNIKQLRNFVRDRLVYCDQQIANGVPATSITLSQSALSIASGGEAVTLTTTVLPTNTTDSIMWLTSNATVATVSNGVVTPVADGTCTIRAKCGSGYAVCEVTVSSEPDPDEPAYTNQVPTSIDTDGSVFNGTGYKNGYRLSSTGAEKELETSTVSGFIRASAGDTIRIKGVEWYQPTLNNNYIVAYKSDFSMIGATSGAAGSAYGTQFWDSVSNDAASDTVTFTLSNISDIYYIRVSSAGDKTKAHDGADMIVTVNEEIT